MKLRKTDWDVRPIEHADARALVERFHYAGGAGNTSVHRFGLFKAGSSRLLGATIWLPPTRPAARKACREVGLGADPACPSQVLSLSRTVVAPEVPKNAASYLVGRSIRQIRRDKRWRVLVTYADEGQGHTGAIYRATNWTPAGTTRPRHLWRDAAGKLRSPRAGRPHARRNLTEAEMAARGWVKTPVAAKRRFVLRLR